MASPTDEYSHSEESWQQENRQPAPKEVHISLSLIAERSLPADIREGPHDKLISSIMKLTHIRLDRENIVDIDNLEMLGPVTNIYLQQNQIKRLENLDSLMMLRFLTLAGNQIVEIENINMLDELKFLDISDNKIESFDPEEFPKTLLILNLDGNPCTRKLGYRSSLLKVLPNLQQLDNVDVTRHEWVLAGCDVSDSSESEDEEEIIDDQPVVSDNNEDNSHGDVLQLSADLILESQNRKRQYLAEHQQRMDVIDEVRAQSQLTMNTGRSLKDSPRSDRSTSQLSR